MLFLINHEIPYLPHIVNMLKICIFLAVAIVPFITADFQLYTGQHEFSISMLKALEKNYPKQSHIFSPHSTYRALLHALLGLNIDKETFQSLNQSMHLTWAKSESDIVEAYKKEIEARSDRILGAGIEFESADRIYTSKELK